ncbi:hypothetical protein [Mucisphaera sp.]
MLWEASHVLDAIRKERSMSRKRHSAEEIVNKLREAAALKR